jgi:hypothetical protein
MIVIAASAALCAGCGSGSSSGGSAPASSGGTSSATATIEKNWTTFFDYRTPTAEREALLEDGTTLGKAMAMGDSFAKSQHLKEQATVSSVTLTDATHASVKYTITNAGSPLFSGATGDAILQDGQWKVAKHTFCTLIELGAVGKTVPGCSVTS